MSVARTVARLISLVLAASLVAGCAATAQISLDPELRQRLGEMGETRGVHYYAPAGMRVISSRSLQPTPTDKFLPVEPPVKRVKDRFLAAVAQELGLTKLQIIDEPRGARVFPLMAPPIELLKKDFRDGLVFDFYTGVWELALVYQPLPFATPRYWFGTFVRARLVRLDDSTILWQQICLPAGLKPEVRTLDEWLANDYALLHAEVEREAQYCANDLVARFLGKH